MDESLDGAEYAVFDDMQGGFKFFHSYKFWLGGQKEFWVTDKYRHKEKVYWDRPAIWVCNKDPMTWADDGVDYDWLNGNCDIVEVTEAMVSTDN